MTKNKPTKKTAQTGLPADDSPTLSEPQPTIVWVFGKGGVAKSQVAEAAFITLKSLGHEVRALDADVSNSSLTRKLSDAVLVEGGNAAEIVENIEQEIVQEVLGNHKSMVVDTGNGSDNSSRRWFESQHMAKILAANGVKVIAVTVVDSSPDSASHVLETMDALVGANHMVVMNLGHVPGDIGEKAFSPLLADNEFNEYLQKATVITLPRLTDVVALDVAGARLHQIMDGTNNIQLSPFVQARTHSWLTEVISKFTQAFINHH